MPLRPEGNGGERASVASDSNQCQLYMAGTRQWRLLVRQTATSVLAGRQPTAPAIGMAQGEPIQERGQTEPRGVARPAGGQVPSRARCALRNASSFSNVNGALSELSGGVSGKPERICRL